MSPIPEPTDPLLSWAMDNPTAVREAIRRINLLTGNVQVVITNTGASQLSFTDRNAILTISTKDIDLGTISGSKGANAALSSLMTALKRLFTVTDSTS